MRFLLDEMYPPRSATLLRERHGHDAVHVREAGLAGAEDAAVAAHARADGRVLVTENVTDFVRERDIVLVFVLKRRLPAGGAQASGLVDVLARWATANPEPYVGAHWPS